MKNKLILILALATLALPVMAEDFKVTKNNQPVVVLTPTKLYDFYEELRDKTEAELDTLGKAVGALQKRASGSAERDKLYQQRIEVLEKKVTHITNILKLKQENGK